MSSNDIPPRRTVPGVPEGMFIPLPQPTQPGEVIPPIPCAFSAGLTNPDSKGNRWVILQGFDGTMSATFRIPWQIAAQIGAQIAAGLAEMQQKAASEQNGGLIVPGGNAGGLLVPDAPRVRR